MLIIGCKWEYEHHLDTGDDDVGGRDFDIETISVDTVNVGEW